MAKKINTFFILGICSISLLGACSPKEVDSSSTEPSEVVSSSVTSERKEIESVIDFDVFTSNKPYFDLKTAKAASVIAAASYHDDYDDSVIIDEKTCAYDELDAKHALLRYGFESIYKYDFPTSSEDADDIAVAYIGVHQIIKDGKTIYVFGATLDGYPIDSCWSSNIDIGADTSTYTSLTGTHTLWTDKKNHKGFDVSSNRFYEVIESHISTNYPTVQNYALFICGHSRGAAICNLTAKKFTDAGIKTIAYCFNVPNNTCESNKSVLTSYTNIFTIKCDQDLVGYIPTSGWGFTTFGIQYHVDLSTRKTDFKKYFGYKLEYLPKESIDAISNYLHTIASTREKVYEYRPEDPNIPEIEEFSSQEEANTRKDTLVNLANQGGFTQYVDFSLINVIGDPLPYKVKIKTRPAIINSIVTGIVTGNISTGDLLIKYSPILSRYITEISNIGIIGLDFNKLAKEVSIPHEPMTTVYGVDFIEIVNENS